MISEVVMPQMGADMVEGTIVAWRKHEGDAVERGEIIAEIETDKANVEIEAFESGVFRKTLAQEGDVIPIGGVIAIIADAGDDISSYTSSALAPAASKPAPASAVIAAAPPAPAAPAVAAPPRENGRLRVSPVARHIAEERGVDLRGLRGSGPDGRIIKRDVEAAATAPARAAAAGSTPQPLGGSKMRQAIARRMAQSKREAPHYYLLVDIDMTESMAFRKQANAALPAEERISVNDLIVRACALALQRHPAFNVTFDGDQAVRRDAQHVCIAIALDDGLIAPALLDAGRKTLAEIARASTDLVARAKGGSLRPDEITAGTFTITNLGAYGVETLIGIIQPPQTAILGTGSVLPQPAARDGAVVVRDVMKVALSADHRITDGAQGAQFLGEIKRLLEAPLLLVL
jgi:pyruvate dehydrogenase E2 component (dihydrolipoamide acetyltransferase)